MASQQRALIGHDDRPFDCVAQLPNVAYPAMLQQRYNDLVGKRRAEQLTLDEHTELLALTDQIEQAEADRAAALASLAQIRQTSVRAVMQALGLKVSYA